MCLARFPLLLLPLLLGAPGAPASWRPLPNALPNDNRVSAGAVDGSVLSLSLEARLATWHPDGDSLPGRVTAAFAENGKGPVVPGPLIRVPAGSEVRITVRNAELPDTLLFFIPRQLRGGATASPGDTTVVPPGELREIRFTASRPGTFHYRALGRDRLSRALEMYGLLGGAVVVDSAGPAHAGRDRVFVLLWSVDSLTRAGQQNIFTQAPGPAGQRDYSRSLFAINGRSWPHTERLSATVGDSVRWRVVNLSADVHPMHLHGFYFRVDDFDGAAVEGQATPGRMVVTERMPGFSAMSVTWVPERAGNWLFHCHFAAHLLPTSALADGGRGIFVAHGTEPAASHEEHAMSGMAGLVLGVTVHPRGRATMAEPARDRRRLRLVAVQDSGFPENAPSLRFRLEDGRVSAEAGPGFSPPIDLRRGEPVSITVVNTLREPTAVHWHGMELESVYDGVPGFSGGTTRIAPVIAPGDSFEARFTPPRAGTFIYHSHLDEPRQHRAGLLGALIVRDARDGDEVIALLKAPRGSLTGEPPVEVNGQSNPDTVVLHAGQPARVRLISLTYAYPNATVWLTARPDSSFPNLRDTMVVQWRPVAKDGADLPPASRAPRPARQTISMGETYDFSFTPPRRGIYRLEIRGVGPTSRLFARVPLRAQ